MCFLYVIMYLVIIAVLNLTLITLIYWRAFMSCPAFISVTFLLREVLDLWSVPAIVPRDISIHLVVMFSWGFVSLLKLFPIVFSLITEQSTAQLSFLLHLILCSKGREAMNTSGTMLIVDSKTCGQREHTATSRMLSPLHNWLGRGTASIKEGKGLYPPSFVCPCKWWAQFCS